MSFPPDDAAMTVQFDADCRQWLVLDRGVIVARFKTSEEAWRWEAGILKPGRSGGGMAAGF